MPQKPTFGKRSSFDRCRFPRYADGWLGHETADIVKRRQERFNFAAHRFLGTANFVEKLRSLIGSVLQRGIKNFFYLLPLFVCHFSDVFIQLLNSRCSQALATFQSRAAVAREIFRASAVSSRLKPLKYRSSTSRTCCSSIFARRFRASSRAIKSTSCSSTVMSNASSKGTLTASPPRFSRCLARA